MHRAPVILAVAATVLLTACALSVEHQPAGEGVSDLEIQVDKWAEAALADGTVAGRSVAVEQDGQLQRAQGHGLAGRAPDGPAVRCGEVFLGHVEVANPFNARLVLVSDPANKPRRVRIVALRDGKTVPLNAQFLLRGLGRFKMQLYEVHHQYIEKGDIRIGDLVMTSESSGPVEIPLNIGVVTEIQKNLQQPLLYECTVESKVDLETVRQVYLVVRSGGGKGQG